MRKRRSSKGVTVNAVAGSHVVMLGLDLAADARPGCLGFAIQREDHTEDERAWMRGTKTFPGTPSAGSVSSREHPFQSFQWSDYSAKPQHDYSYGVVPLYGGLKPGPRVSVRVTTESEGGATHSVYFNRGSVATQEYVRQFGNVKPTKLAPERRAAAYEWLSRGLLEAFEAFAARAEGPGFGLRGAIYEFQWPAALAAIGAAAQRKADVKVLFDEIDPAGSPGAKNVRAIAAAAIGNLCLARTTGTIMHNKFLVLTRDAKPVAVWTGSTNLTENGIFGHLNCGHVVEDATIAGEYLAYWEQISAQPSPQRTPEVDWVVANNIRPPDPWDPLTAVFSPHRGKAVLDWYATLAGRAQAPGDALFMSFAFGMDKRFQAVYETDDSVLRVALMDKMGAGAGLKQALIDIPRIRRRRNVVIAIGNRVITNAFDRWLSEPTGLTSNVQWVHSKFMLVNPLSNDPIVVTGSANFSGPSTDENNENMLVIRGDKRVADIYLGEFMRLYSHYAFRDTLARQAQGQAGVALSGDLAGDDSWQDAGYFTPGSSRELRRRYFART
jgi:hypothetical protein